MKIKKIKNNMHKIKCNKCNLSSFINFCTTNGLTLHLLTHKADESVEFCVTDNDLHKLIELDNKSYNFQVVQIGGLRRLLNTLISRIGLVIGLILSIVTLLLLNNKLFHINIIGLNNIDNSVVINSIKEFGLSTFSNLDFNKNELENYLSKKFNFSLVSVITKGNTLIVSVKEEIPEIEDSYVAITADFNMLINTINVYSGTSRVKDGDIVYKGDVLVDPFICSGDDKVFLTPRADICATVFFSCSYTFKSTDEILVRTGKKKLISSDVYLGKYLISTKKDSYTFDFFEEKQCVSEVSKYFLPIKINKTYLYELTKKTINKDFEKEKSSIISSLKEDVYSKVPNNWNVDDEEIVITDIDNGKIVNVYLECNIKFKY